MPKFWLMMTMFSLSQLALAESFPKEDEEWQIRRPDTPSWNQEDDIPAARGRKRPSKEIPKDEFEEVEQEPASTLTEQPPPPPPRRPPEPQPEPETEARELTSVEEPSSSEASAETESPTTNRPIKFRLGLLGGVSNLKTNDSASQNARVEQALTQNFFLGGALDARFGRYFQVEGEGFYGLAPDIELADASGGNAQVKKLRQYGAFFSGVLRLPLGGLVPKLGIGYGFVGLGHRHQQTAALTETNEQGLGAFALAGLDFELSDVVTLSGDYSRALGASAHYSSVTTNTPAVEEDSTASFERIRIGAFYRFSRRMLAGAMFHLVSLSTSLKPHNTTSPTGSEVMSQFMFVGMTEF